MGISSVSMRSRAWSLEFLRLVILLFLYGTECAEEAEAETIQSSTIRIHTTVHYQDTATATDGNNDATEHFLPDVYCILCRPYDEHANPNAIDGST